MIKIPRRAALGALGTGLIGAGVLTMTSSAWTPASLLPTGQPSPSGNGRSPRDRPGLPRGHNPVAAENKLLGTQDWMIGQSGTRATNDRQQQVQGYASATSVNLGGSVDFHIQATEAYTISIYRLGYYGGAGARHLTTSPLLRSAPQPAPALDPSTGLIDCDWDPVWRLNVPRDWVSGVYLAVFTSELGWRSMTPFVVRDDQRAAAFCVVLPFSTYQAYNRWPLDGRLGKSLYNGYELSGPNRGHRTYERRAVKVSFNRPYSGHGLPSRFDSDHDFIRWVEQVGYDVTYASTLDLHSGVTEPDRYAGLIFCGHDEYWSPAMRNAAKTAVTRGTSLGFMTANNIYWRVRFEPSTGGRNDRVVVCHRTDPGPPPDPAGPTVRWRDIDRVSAEQELLGVQYNGIVAKPAPLVVQSADHWFWAGSQVKDGERIAKMVDGEADGLNLRAPRPRGVAQALLSASPYKVASGKSLVQNTSLYETAEGGVVFVAGTFNWPLALGRPGRRDRRIRTATTNLLDRMQRPRA